MRLFRRTQKFPDGTKRTWGPYWVQYHIRGRLVRVSLRTRDKRSAEIAAAELVKKAELRAAGVFEPHRRAHAPRLEEGPRPPVVHSTSAFNTHGMWFAGRLLIGNTAATPCTSATCAASPLRPCGPSSGGCGAKSNLGRTPMPNRSQLDPASDRGSPVRGLRLGHLTRDDLAPEALIEYERGILSF